MLAKPFIAVKKKKEIERQRKKIKETQWQEVDGDLFERLRTKRRELATQKRVPAFIIFGDKTLREMAQQKPLTPKAFASVYGVGEKKQEAYAAVFIEVIEEYQRGR